MQAGQAAALRAGGGAKRAAVLAVVAGTLAFWTIVCVGVPSTRLSVAAPRLRQSLETINVVAAALTASMAYVRYTFARERVWLYISLAFLVIALNQLVFGIIVEPDTLRPQHGPYLWTSARLLAAGLLLLGAARGLAESHETGSAALQYLHRALAVVAVLAAAQAAIWLLRTALPALIHGPLGAGATTGFRPSITTADVVVGLVGAALFAWAVFAYRRSAIAEPTRTWLLVALMFAASSHIHYTLLPTIYTARVSTGDALRLAMSVVLLAGLIADVRRSYAAERDRARELDALYRLERDRVKELEHIERVKADVVRILTHELLHPVAAIRALTLGLRRGWTRLDDTEKLAALDGLVGQSDQLNALASHAPDIGELRADMFALSLERREVSQLLGMIERTFSMPEDRLLVVTHPSIDGRTVNVDAPRIMQVFHNLLSNAAKFAPDGTVVQLAAEAHDGVAIFRVRDDGPGVPREAAGRVFERFFRLDRDVEAHAGGQGLGLYISRLIVEAHGGRIWVDSSSAHVGTTLAFSLPSPQSAD